MQQYSNKSYFFYFYITTVNKNLMSTEIIKSLYFETISYFLAIY